MLGIVSQTRVSGGNRTHDPHANSLAYYALDYQGTHCRCILHSNLQNIFQKQKTEKILKLFKSKLKLVSAVTTLRLAYQSDLYAKIFLTVDNGNFVEAAAVKLVVISRESNVNFLQASYDLTLLDFYLRVLVNCTRMRINDFSQRYSKPI